MIAVRFGNLEIKDVVREKYVTKVTEYFDNNGYQREERCDQVSRRKGNYHIYELPRMIVICGEDKMMQFYGFLKDGGLTDEAFVEGLNLSYEVFEETE